MTPKTLQELDEFLSRWLKPVDYPMCMSMPEAFRGRLKEAGLVIVPRELMSAAQAVLDDKPYAHGRLREAVNAASPYRGQNDE